MKTLRHAATIVALVSLLFSAEALAQKKYKLILPEPSTTPNAAQRAQIARKYGMFMHFGINTFNDTEWSDGSLPVSSYNPERIDADQWICTAKQAGMKYVILITKHHDGFCLWDRKQNADTDNQASDDAYNRYMLAQINELVAKVSKITPIVELWFDGGWTKPAYRWPVCDLYQAIKSKQPDCQVGINWSIGRPDNPDFHAVHPNEQKEGFPIRYFPSDFRLGDPDLPVENDPKLFTHDSKTYYMPWESTVCISQRWFYNTKDTKFKSVDELEKLYRRATANDNILILNCPPGRDGRLRQADIDLLLRLRERIDSKN